MASVLLDYKYLSAGQLAGFDKYKYSSVDTSPLSNYVMHPFWNQLVKLCPLWLPPNLLTLTGWLLSFFLFIILSYYDPHFVSSTSDPQTVPRWVWLMGAIIIFWSHQLDGIDGKQARRTNSSSPLGELFDHGLDSIIVWLMTGGIFSCFGLGDKTASVLELVIIDIVVLYAFYISHWEKYTTSVMYLPWAYDLSQIWLSASYLFTFIYGPTLWRVPVFHGYNLAQIFKRALYVIAPTFCIPMSLVNQFEARKKNPEKCVGILEGLVPIFSLLSVSLTLFTFGYVSSENIVVTQPRLLLMVFGLLYSNINCRLIVAQMSASRCDRYNILAWPMFCMIGASMLNVANEASMLACYAVFLSIAHLHYGVCVVRQLCDHLNVYAFKVGKPPVKQVDVHTYSVNGVHTNGTVPNGKCAQD